MRTSHERAGSTSGWDGDTVYQVYVPAFNEHQPEGVSYRGNGNLRGIREKADYLHDLGVNSIWTTPFYPSPMIDNGYDIADYTEVNPLFGTLDDARELVDEYHSREMKVMIDLVPNHTSDQHDWFKESRSSRDNSKSDWYIWHDPAPGGGPPNNWSSVFSFPNLRARERGELIVPDGENTPPVSAWEWDETRQQYYLRDFDKTQPNLNWANPEVRAAMLDVMRIWIERGIDGFRVDVANHLGKNPAFTDEEPDPNYREGIDNPHDQHKFFNSLNYPPALYPYLQEITDLVKEYPGRDLRMILECWMPPEDLQKVDRVAPEVASSFNFTRLTAPWDGSTHQKLLNDYHANLPSDSIPNQVLSNHDVSRVASRLGKDAARAAAVLNLTLPGMIFIYNGEEGGFTDVDVPKHRRRDDGLGERDKARVPISWDSSLNAGFSQASEGDLWLPVDPEYETTNLEAQAKNPHSSFSLYRTLLHLRNATPVLRRGTYAPLLSSHPDIVSFARRSDHDQTMTLVNFSDQIQTPRIGGAQQIMGRVIVSSLSPHPNRPILMDEPIVLQPNEALVIARSA